MRTPKVKQQVKVKNSKLHGILKNFIAQKVPIAEEGQGASIKKD